ncbi:unnamed protein product [Ectocarpus sp. 8 AP-2014]
MSANRTTRPVILFDSPSRMLHTEPSIDHVHVVPGDSPPTTLKHLRAIAHRALVGSQSLVQDLQGHWQHTCCPQTLQKRVVRGRIDIVQPAPPRNPFLIA